MSPGPHHFDFPGFSATLPARKGSSASLCHRPSRLSDVTPPPINRNLKPNRKCEFLTAKFSLMWKLWFWFLLIAIVGVKSPTKSALLIVFFAKTMTFVECLVLFSTAKPTPLDLKNNGIIDELPFKSPVTMSWTRPMWVSYKSFRTGYPRSLVHTHTYAVWWHRLVLYFVSAWGQKVEALTVLSALLQARYELHVLPALSTHFYTKHHQHRLGRQRGELCGYGESQ